jgi:excisionase family DNA binding protein
MTADTSIGARAHGLSPRDASLADDILPTTSHIAAYMGISEERVRRLCRDNALPHFRLGKMYGARKSSIREALDAAERGNDHAA